MKLLCFILFCAITFTTATAQQKIKVAPKNGDATKELQAAIEKARGMHGKAVVIELQNANYHLYRESSSKQLYHVSNTASERDNPDQTKHVGLWLKGLKNVTIDGQGAKLITHGEMTSYVIDECENITLKNFTINAADPTMPELTVKEVGHNYMTVEIHPLSKYTINNGKFAFTGEGWTLSGGIAQGYDREKDITWRGWSPLNGLQKAIELEPNVLRFVYNQQPDAKVGAIFQMRDGIRDEVCGLIQRSKNTTLERIHFAFLGNFSIVGQVAENITYRNLTLEPESGSGRTSAGFADFVHMSGCKGKIIIENSRFSGAQDDPINIHGTFLQVLEFPTPNQALVKYMHHQTYGFQSFYKGDQIELTDAHSLMSVISSKVKTATMKNEREILITFEKALPKNILEKKDLVIENVTYTPEVEIRGNYFSRIPTRGVLVSTRGKVVIENNVFFRMQMSGILIAGDANSWFESGMVRDVTIRGNNFIECGTPVIFIAPENSKNEGFVHRNINITSNRFQLTGGDAVFAKSVDGLQVKNNLFMPPSPMKIEELVKTEQCRNVIVENNIIEPRH